MESRRLVMLNSWKLPTQACTGCQTLAPWHTAAPRDTSASPLMPRPSTEPFVQHFNIDLPAQAPDSFEGFAAIVGPMFDLIRVHKDQPFHARVTGTCLPDIYLTRTVAAASRYKRDGKTIAKSGTDAIVVLAYLSGGFTFETDERTQAVGANEIAFFDLGRPLCIEAAFVDNISLVVSRHRLEELTASVRDIHGYVLKSGATRDLLLAHMHACVDVGHRMPAADAAAISEVSIRMVAASWNSVIRHTAAAPRHTGLVSLGDIKSHIEAHLGDPALGPAQLLQTFSLSRATLYRMFEPAGGVSAFILERRMHRAFQLITAPGADKPRIKQLALAVGFEHASAFSRAFKKQFGVSPQEVRLRQVVPKDASAKPWKVPRSVTPLMTDTNLQGDQ